MNDITRERILRRLEGMSDDQAYQVLDYIEFLQSKYGTQPRAAGPFQKLAETLQDTLRAGRLPVAAVAGTMNAVDAAGRVMRGLAAAGREAVEQLAAPPSRPADPPAPEAQSKAESA
jgi:hypothetical protein